MPRFPYTRAVNPLDKSFLRFKNHPLLKVGIVSNSKLMAKSLAYIDTGAQYCLFDNAYAKQLGIEDYKNTALKI